MESQRDWPWDRSLAAARPDTPLQVEQILFGVVRERCSELGIREGSVVVCHKRNDRSVDLELPNGAEGRLDREYAWFVLVGTIH